MKEKLDQMIDDLSNIDQRINKLFKTLSIPHIREEMASIQGELERLYEAKDNILAQLRKDGFMPSRRPQ